MAVVDGISKSNQAVADTKEVIKAHKFFLMIAGAVLLAIVMATIAMTLYNSSGTAQLDLSRPDYQAVRNKINRDNQTKSYSPIGTLNKQSFDEYKKLYDEQMKKAIDNEGFSGDALSNGALRFSGLDNK